MDDDLKLVERLADYGLRWAELAQGSQFTTIDSQMLGDQARMNAAAATAITRLHAEIEALKSDVSDLVRAGSDEATENERLVKERDEALADNAKLRRMMEAREKLGEAFGVDMHKNATEIALEFAQREINATIRAETAEAQRDAALAALRPFAECAKHHIGEGESSAETFRHCASGSHRVTVGHFRAASRTLEGE